MGDEEFSAHRNHLDVELLAQLAACRVDVRLGRFELAAGKFPQSAVSLVKRPAADQKASFVLNDSSEDADRCVSQGCGDFL